MDNSVEDINVKRLKTRILETASKQNYWGEIIPAKWIALESIIVALKDDGLKVLFVTFNRKGLRQLLIVKE